jgi:hypothetical protein
MGMLTSGVVLLHENACLQTAAHTRALPEHFELSNHPPNSSDPAPSDYHLFTYLKNWLGSQCFNSKEEVMEGVKMQLSSQVADFFDTGIQKLIPPYRKCHNSSGDNTEK